MPIRYPTSRATDEPRPLSGRPLLHRRLRADQAALLHDALREEDDLPVEQQEARQVEALDQPKLLPETLVHPLRHPAAVAPRGRLVAEPPQVALGRVALRHGWVRQGVAEVGAEIEVAPLRDAEGVGDGLRTLPEEHLHLGMGLQVQMMVGLQVRQRLIYGRVEPGGDQRVLEAGAFGTVVVDVVGGDHRDADFPGDSDQLPVAVGVPVQKVPMELDVDRAGTVPVQVPLQKVVGITWATAHRQFRETPVAPARQQDDTLGVVGQKRGVEPRLPAVGGVGGGEEPGDVGVPGPRLCQQREAGAVGQGQLAAHDGPDVQAVCKPRELQRPAEVGVGQGQRGVPVLLRLRQQLVRVGCPSPEGVEALGVKLYVAICHQALCRYQRSSLRSRNRVIRLPSPWSIR